MASGVSPTAGSPKLAAGTFQRPLAGVLQLLSQTNDEYLRRLSVPETLVLDSNGEPEWYYRHTGEHGLRRVSARGWSPDEVRRRFSQPPLLRIGNRVVPTPVTAVFVTAVSVDHGSAVTDRVGRGPTPLLSCDYLTPHRLAALFSVKRPQGILQRYQPTGARHSVVQAVWTPFLMVLEKRRCVHQIDDSARTIAERTATAASSQLSEEVPMAPARQTEIEHVCRRIYSAALTQENAMVTRFVAYFSTSPLTFLWTSSVAAMSAASVQHQARAASPRLQVSRPPPISPPASPPAVPRREGAASLTTTPANTPATPGSPGAEQPFDLEVLPFQKDGRWAQEPAADLVVFLSGEANRRPDGYLVVPPTGTRPQSGATRTAEQQQQLFELSATLPLDTDAVATTSPLGSAGPSVASARLGSQGPRTARKIAAIAAGAALLQAAGVSSPQRGRRDGVHSVRQKYLAAAQASLLQDGGKSVDVGSDDERKIPAHAREHVLKFGTVGGAGRARSVKTRPPNTPTSKLLSVLNVVAGDEDDGTAPDPAMTRQELEQAAGRVITQRDRARAQKARLAPPHASHPLPPAPAALQLLDPPRAATAPPPTLGSPSPPRSAASTLPADAVLEATALAGTRAGWLRQQTPVVQADRSQRAREVQWNGSYVTEGMLAHMPRSFTKDFAKSRAWLYDLETLRPSTGAQAVLLERQRNAIRRQRRQEEQQRAERLAQSKLGRLRDPDLDDVPSQGGGIGGLFSATRQQRVDPIIASAAEPAQRAPTKLGRKPLNSTGDQHQSLSEAMRTQSKRSARKLMQQASAARAQMKSATVAPHTQHSTLLDALFAPRRDPSERQAQAEQTSRLELERRRQSEQRRDLEERARRLEALRQKRQKLQQLREETKIRSQYSAIEAKYHNQLAVDFVEDILYQAYSRGLEVREVGSRGGSRPGPGAQPQRTEDFKFTIPAEMWGSMQELHSMLLGLKFSLVLQSDGSPPARTGTCPVSPSDAVYSVSSDKVVLSNMMQELAAYKACVERVFAQRDVAVIQRLKELIDTHRQDVAGDVRGMPLFEAVKVIRSEFGAMLDSTGDADADVPLGA
eukprot:TRINITY_DN2881_c0_g1_i1.p1 TRINITY_DN2881_c0_g1~~TRINITY_DN2881_c0_g1_i1.p1  ORF type:complete len:1103 (+),score=352.06 TRINITY_DN2881_c0_g1_i1:58-3309(+)